MGHSVWTRVNCRDASLVGKAMCVFLLFICFLVFLFVCFFVVVGYF